MYRILLSLVMLAAFASFTIAEEASAPLPPTPDTPVTVTEAPVPDSNAKADPAFGVKYTEEQVISLPQDQNKFYTTIIGTPGEAKFEAIKAWFEKVPELKNVRAQTHWNAIETTSVMFKERYQKTVPSTPCIRVQAADGTTLYQCSGDNVPMSGEALTKAINSECLRRWRKKQGSGPNPDTTPAPDVAPDSKPDAQPDVGPDTTPDDTKPDSKPDMADELYAFPWLLVGSTLAIGIVIGAGSMAISMYRKKYLAPQPK